MKPTSVAADVIMVGAFGLGVVMDRAFAAGVASVPGPFTDASWEGWFVWRSFSNVYEFHTAASALLLSVSQEVDSKGMRKVSADETIVLVAESQSGGFDISMPIRLLLKLS